MLVRRELLEQHDTEPPEMIRAENKSPQGTLYAIHWDLEKKWQPGIFPLSIAHPHPKKR